MLACDQSSCDFSFLSRSFYGLGDAFPGRQLMCRTKTGKKRHIYFVSDTVRNIVENNADDLKVFCAYYKLGLFKH